MATVKDTIRNVRCHLMNVLIGLGLTLVASGLGFAHIQIVETDEYHEGYGVGFDEGHSIGFDVGLERGQREGTKEGRAVGFDEGWANGYRSSFESAYAAGVSQGAAQAAAEVDSVWLGSGAVHGGDFITWNSNKFTITGGAGISAGGFIRAQGLEPSEVVQLTFDDGFEEGYDRGFEVGDERGFDEAFQPAYDAAYAIAYDHGTDAGNRQGATDGGDAGFSAGFNAVSQYWRSEDLPQIISALEDSAGAVADQAVLDNAPTSVANVPEPAGVFLLIAAICAAFLARRR